MNKNDKEEWDLTECLTTGQAASVLRIAPGTLQNWRSAGEGPLFIKHRRNVYYPISELERYKRQSLGLYESTSEWKEKNH